MQKIRSIGALWATTAIIALACGAQNATAQTAGDGASTSSDTQPAPSVKPTPTANSESTGAEIVVTGTLLRGIAPTGTNSVNLSAADIAKSGATSTNQVLARIPQVSSAFGQVPALSGIDPGTSILRPNLRNLGAAGGSTTLVLVDGHRQVDAGILITSPDPDVIPPAVLERVDVVPDGGSSIYGSDAVGGVINFITRKRFDGFKVDARGGVASNYSTFDTNVTAGKDWGSGSAYLSISYAKNDAILGRERGYFRQVSPQTGTCNPGTVSVTAGGATTTYALLGRVAGTIANCDNTDNVSVIPAVERLSEFGSLTQHLWDGIDLDVKAFHTRRETTSYADQNRAGQVGQITSTNPYYVAIGANDPGTQTVNFSYAGVASPAIHNVLEEFGITPTITADLGHNWQLRVLGNFQRSSVTQTQVVVDGVAQGNALTSTSAATALNPYNPGASAAAVLNSILLTELDAGRQNLINGRAIIDGSPFSLPGGEVKLALGTEFIRQTLANSITGSYTGATNVSRNVKSVFGEIAVPVVGSANAMPGIRALTLSASGRYDNYSDFGGTFNPKLGATYKPVDWLSIRANWGKSFNAPSLADKNGAPDTRAVLIPVSPWADPKDPSSVSSRPTILIAGGNGALKPQKAQTWSVGMDAHPQFAPGLTLSATYYNIHLKDQIGIIPIFTGNTYVASYAAYYLKNPTLAQAQSIVGNLPLVGAGSLASFYNSAGSPYVLLDARRQNLGLVNQDGIDFNAKYTRRTGFGTIDASIGGTYTLDRDIAGAVGQPFVDDLTTPGGSRLSLLTSLGFSTGGFSATGSWSHRGGYSINPAISGQTSVSSFDTLDLFMSYDFNGSGASRDLSLTMTINNLTNATPPYYAQDPGYTNGSTIGRLIQFGFSKKF